MQSGIPRIYHSERGYALLYTGQPIEGKSILTLENYTKWYDIHLVNPDGSVSAVDVRILHDAQEIDSKAQWVDHLYHPRLLYRVAEILKAEFDERAIEVAAGRWMLEKFDCSDILTPLSRIGNSSQPKTGEPMFVSGGFGVGNARASNPEVSKIQSAVEELDFHDPNFDNIPD